MSTTPEPPLPEELKGGFTVSGRTNKDGKVIPGFGTIKIPKGFNAYHSVNKEVLQKLLDASNANPKTKDKKTVNVKVFQVYFCKYVPRGEDNTTFVPPGA